MISECAGFDIVDFYRKHSNGSGYLRLNRKVKAKYIQKMKELCDELENTTSEYRKRDLRKRLQRLKKQLNQYDCYRGY